MHYKTANTILIAAAAILLLSGCEQKQSKARQLFVQTEYSDTHSEEGRAQSFSDEITPEEARETALNLVHLNETDVTFLYETIVDDRKSRKYDIQFVDDTSAYIFEIDASNGKILFFASDPDFYKRLLKKAHVFRRGMN